MPYLIKTTDKPGSLDLRDATRAEHLAYLKQHTSKILAAGALLDDDGTGGHGGVIILDVDDRASAEAFINGDPFTTAGLFASVEVTRWRKAFFDGRCLV